MANENSADLGSQLTPLETSLLGSARGYELEHRALEYYAELWDSLDGRFGKGNEVTARYVQEYQQRRFPVTTDEANYRRTEQMKVAFVFPRTSMPEDVIRALSAYDWNRRR